MLRTHGAALEGADLESQLTTFEGGCTTNIPASTRSSPSSCHNPHETRIAVE